MAVYIVSLLFAWNIDIPPILLTFGSNTVLKSTPIMNPSSSFLLNMYSKFQKKSFIIAVGSINIYIRSVTIEHFLPSVLGVSWVLFLYVL